MYSATSHAVCFQRLDCTLHANEVLLQAFIFWSECEEDMSTSTPILASVPYSTLPRIPNSAFEDAHRNIDALLDELDSESDSGYDEGTPQGVVKGKPDSKQPAIQQEDSFAGDDLYRWFRPLLDGPPMYPSFQGQPGESETLPPQSAVAPAWMKWTSSRVLCTDTALATNEDKLECVWLLAGCEDGTVWIFCSILATASTSATETGTSTPRSRAHSELHLDRYRSSIDRPAIRRQKSDVNGSPRKAAVPSSPGSAVSRTGGASGVTASRVTSSNHGRRHRNAHGGSISLAVHGSTMPASHNGAHTPVGRKASATISLTDLDALGHETSTDREPTERAISPPIRTSIASMSLEELAPCQPIDHRQINFEPTAHVYPRASHAPIVSIKLLPPEGYTSTFVCLTANGQLFKFAVRDGMVVDHLDLSKALFPRTMHLSLADCRITYNPDSSRLIVKSDQAGLLVPIDVMGLKVRVSPILSLPCAS